MNDQKSITLLDGGMGQELIHRSKLPPSPLWSAQVMMNEPEIVEEVHREYIRSGAQVITLNSYSATPERLARDASADLFEPLQAKAIEIAQKAIAGSDTQLAGCLPPLFGSYHPEAAPDFETCLSLYRQITDVQKGAVDVFLAETMSSIKEARAATIAAKDTGKTVWCALSVMEKDGTRLRSTEPLQEAIEAVKDEGADVVLLNCSPPESISTGIEILAKANIAFGAYANGFKKADNLKLGGTVDSLEVRPELTPERYADFCRSWVEQGASVIGGCCEIGPAHIAELSRRFIHADAV